MRTRELIIERPLVFLKKQRIFRDKLLRWFLVLAVLSMLAVVVLLIVRVRPVDVVPLGYITTVGLIDLGRWYHIYTYGVFSIIVTLTNSILAMAMLEKSRITSFFLVVGAITVNMFTLVVVYTLLSQIY